MFDPTNPIENELTQLQGSFAQMHEAYTAACHAGFTESQAMQIILEIMRINSGSN